MNPKLRDLIIYCGVGLLVVGGIIVFAEVAPRGTEFPVKAVWLAVITLIVFGYIAKALHRLWRSFKFWMLYALLLALHVLAYSRLLAHWESHFILLTSLFAGAEVVLLCTLIDALVRQ